MKHVYIIDPKLFRDQQWKMEGLLDTIGQYFRTQEKPNFSTMVVKYPREAIGLIQKQVEEAEEDETVRVYAVGGDDIFFDCLNGIIGLPNMEIGSAPHGTVNHFLRSFGDGKSDWEIPSLSSSTTVVPTDVIKVGNNYAINGCAVGLTPAVTVKIGKMNAKLKKGLNRFSAAIWSFLCNLTSMLDKDIIAHQYKIIIDDKDYSGAYSLVNILNGPYFGRKKNPLGGVMPNDGLMDVVLFKSTGILMLLGSFGRYSRGKIPSNCVHVKAKKVVIRSDKPMQIQTDGEYLLDTNITFEIIPEAVQVVTVNNLTYQRSQK